MTITGLDGPCGACERPAGDHTLREWAVCMGTATVELPFAETPTDAAQATVERVRQQYRLDDDLLIADHVDIAAMTLDGAMGATGVSVKLPGVIHDFKIGVPGAAPVPVARLLFVADVAAMRSYGRLVRDGAFGAANAARR